MEKTYNPALIQRTQRYMETHSISQNQFAAKVNLSSAALSSYLNQKYKGSVEAVERQLSEFFKLDEEAEAAAEKTASLLPRAAYVPTSISEDVCQSIRFAQLEHCMVVLHGDAGVGKSKGAQKFLRDHPTNAVGISYLKEEMQVMADGIGTDDPYLTAFLKYKNIQSLNRGIMVELVKAVWVHENGEITVDFNFADEYQRIIDYIENNHNVIRVIENKAI